MSQHESETPATAGHAIHQHEDDAETTWLRAAGGRIIRLHFRQGKTLVGQLLSFDQDTLVVQGGGPAPLLVYKQSLAYLAVEE